MPAPFGDRSACGGGGGGGAVVAGGGGSSPVGDFVALSGPSPCAATGRAMRTPIASAQSAKRFMDRAALFHEVNVVDPELEARRSDGGALDLRVKREDVSLVDAGRDAQAPRALDGARKGERVRLPRRADLYVDPEVVT